MADLRFIRPYAALERHQQEMHAAVQLRHRRLAIVIVCGLAATAAAYWMLPPLALLVAGVAVLAGFFTAITGSSSVPADQMSGAEGEAKVLRALTNLPDEFTIFNQLQIPDVTLPNGRRELDFVVLGPGGLHLIEVKNSGGLIYIRPDDAHWPLAHKAGCGERPGWNAIANPLKQVNAQVAALDRWLLSNGQTAAIHPLVCFARSDVALQDRDASPIPIVTVPEVLEFLTNTSRQGQQRLPNGLIRLLSAQRAESVPALA